MFYSHYLKILSSCHTTILSRFTNPINAFVCFFFSFLFSYIIYSRHLKRSPTHQYLTNNLGPFPRVSWRWWQYQNLPGQPYPFETYGGTTLDSISYSSASHPATTTISQPLSTVTPGIAFLPYIPNTGATTSQKKSKASVPNSGNSSRSKRGRSQDEVRNCSIFNDSPC